MRELRILAAAIVVLGVALTGCDRSEFARGFALDEQYRAERFEQVEAQPVDILFVIDTSCSMEDEQDSLASNFPFFIEFFVDEALPFRIGVTSTNVYEVDSDGLDGRLNGEPKWLEPDTPQLAEKFFERAFMGIDEGHSDELGLHASWVALEERIDSDNADFIRSWANLAIIVVSDEPDYSERTGEPGADDWITWQDHVAWLDAYKDSPEDTQLSALVGISPDGIDDPAGCLHPGQEEDDGGGGPGGYGEGAQRGDGYLEAAIATGGATHSLCSDDWGAMLGHLGLTTAGLLDTFALAEIPLPGSVEVVVGGQRNTDWTWDAELNALVFPTYETVPRPGQSVSVEYRVPEPE